MARIRTIKPEFFTSEDIVALSPLARLLYISTWCEADKEGRLQWKPGTFKLRYLPADACDIGELCGELVSAGLVVLYGDGLAYIPQFAKHQHINPRESESALPDPHAKSPKGTRALRVPTRDDASAREDDAQGGREGKGRERKGREGEEARKRATPLPAPPDVDAQVWSDWLALRKAKRAPVTETVVISAQQEADAAGMTLEAFLRVWCARGSQGLQADWLKPHERTQGVSKPDRIAIANIEVARRYLENERTGT